MPNDAGLAAILIGAVFFGMAISSGLQSFIYWRRERSEAHDDR